MTDSVYGFGVYGFGYCVDCDRPLERPGWDLVCFECQRELDEEVAEAALHTDDDWPEFSDGGLVE